MQAAEIMYLSSSFIGNVLPAGISLDNGLVYDLACSNLDIAPSYEIAITENVLRYEFLIQR